MKKDNILNFWKSFFPTQNEALICKILKNVSNIDLTKIIEKRLTENLISKYNKFFSLNHFTYDLKQYFNDVIDMLSKNIKWIKFCQPILYYYFKRIYNSVYKSEIIKNKRDFLLYFMFSLSNRLFVIYCKTLILELHIANKFGTLKGKSSKNKADYFNFILLADSKYVSSIYNLYPELIRLLDSCVFNSTKYLNEILKETEKKLKNLNEVFGHLGLLLKIDFGIGDSHNNNKSVVKLIFEKNKIIYKPRKLELEFAYCKFLSWINSQKISNLYDLKGSKVFYSTNQGWMECIENIPCTNKSDVNRFYIRVGQLLCILYTLRACDFHYENLIAQKDHPVLIDLETILGNSLFEYSGLKDTETQAQILIRESVLKTALLPSKIINLKNNKCIDIGGVSFSEPQEFPFSSSVIENIENDQVKIVKKFTKSSISFNNPIINGEIVSSKKYINEIKFGFDVMYTWIKSNKEKYIKAVTDIFKKCEYRTILKSTNFYFQMLNISYHPDLLQSSIDRLIFLHRIALTHNVDNLTQNQIVLEEIQQLYNGDIPYFTSFPENKLIYTRNKKKKIEFHNYTSFISIIKQINNMSETDLDYQNFLISASFSLSSENILKAIVKKLNNQNGAII